MVALAKIISGGQTGADRAALDCAIRLGSPHGGKVPKGWGAEDGVIDRQKYPGLEEAPSANVDVRTALNVEESDGTLVITKGPPDRGTRLTLDLARARGKPCLHVDLASAPWRRAIDEVRTFIRSRGIRVLNVAGPRESSVPGGIYAPSLQFLTTALSEGAGDAAQT